MMLEDAKLTGREWRNFLSEVIDRERESMGGLGPFERDFIINTKGNRRINYLLGKAKLHPEIVNVNSPYSGVTGQPSAPPTSFAAIGGVAVETNLWTPNIWTPIPQSDMQAGKIYKVSAGGIFSTTTTGPTSVWTPRAGQSATPASNITLGATTGTTMIASLASVPFYLEFTLVIRALGLAASGASGTGNGFVCVGGLTTAAGIIQVMGGTVATTIDNTSAQGLVISQTWGTSNAGNTLTCQWVTPVRSYN